MTASMTISQLSLRHQKSVLFTIPDDRYPHSVRDRQGRFQSVVDGSSEWSATPRRHQLVTQTDRDRTAASASPTCQPLDCDTHTGNCLQDDQRMLSGRCVFEELKPDWFVY
ncbi:hypothetical protein BaRGS_00012923 [Batillaria attramentaria]|uniref:Uncharacterized protein n=1 Tax=Batillaria attramentaria TaxID=370345 RepID=A0ABD0L9L1_9CAEN